MRLTSEQGRWQHKTHIISLKELAEGVIPGGGGVHPPKPEIWRKLLELTQYMWQNREILTDLGWTIIILTLKRITNTWGISLIETLWKVVEAIINTRLKVCITFHGVLHGLRKGI